MMTKEKAIIKYVEIMDSIRTKAWNEAWNACDPTLDPKVRKNLFDCSWGAKGQKAWEDVWENSKKEIDDVGRELLSDWEKFA